MIDDGVFQLDGVKCTVKGPAFSAQWIDELEGPFGYWLGSRKSGYSDGYSANENMAQRMGAGAVWVQTATEQDSYTFEQIIELT
jgi:hypothetical protein